MFHKYNSVKSLFSFFLIALTISLGYFVAQNEFYKILPLYSAFFIIYLAILHFVKTAKDIKFFIGIALLLKLILVFALPALSDDLYRFIWDGRLIWHGINPFDHLPSYFIEEHIQLEGINQSLYDQLNSQKYFSVYPPVAQAVFAIAVGLFPKSIIGASIVMKLFLLLGEVGCIFIIIKLLKQFQLPSKNVLWYALNPLILFDIMGNLHFEGLMIFFLLLAIYLLIKARSSNANIAFSAIAYALSIASKLLPLIFLPFLIKRLGWKKSLRYFTIIGVVLLLLFLPLLNGLFFNNFGDSLNLYFQKFEFNGSVYYLARYIGTQFKGYNPIKYIGPSMGLLTFLSVLVIAFLEKKWDWKKLPLMMLMAICIYLAFTPTVHPWYVSLPIVLSVFTKYRFPILWSALVILTYANYSYVPYYENLWIVGFEYVLLSIFVIYEIRKNKI